MKAKTLSKLILTTLLTNTFAMVAFADNADTDLSNITNNGKEVIKQVAEQSTANLAKTDLSNVTADGEAKIKQVVEQSTNTLANTDLSNITEAGKNVIQ